MTVILNKTLNTNNAAGTGAFTTLERFAANSLSPAAGTHPYDQVRIRLNPATASGNFTFSRFYIGHGAPSGNVYAFAGDQVEVTFNGGQHGCTLVTSGPDVYSDIINFPLDVTKPVIIAYDGPAGSARDVHTLTGATNCDLWFDQGTGGNDAATTAKTNYGTVASRIDVIAGIEVFIGESSQPLSSEAASSDRGLVSDAKLIRDAKSSDDAVSSQRAHDAASSSDQAHFYAWNEFDRINISLSDVDHIATATAVGNAGVRGNHGHASGKFYLELTVDDASQLNQFNTYGIATAAQVLNSSPYHGSINFIGLILGEYGGGGNFNMGQVTIRLAVDFDQNIVQWGTSLDGGNFWFAPEKIGQRGATWFPYTFIQFATQNTQVTINGGDRAFRYAVPLGFQPWNAGSQGPSSASLSTVNSILVGSLSASGATGANRLLIRSTDAHTWTIEDSPLESNNASVGASNFIHSPELNRFVAIKNETHASKSILTSPEGINWTEQLTPSGNNWNGGTWSPTLRLFVVVGNSGSQRVMTSPDGFTWTLRSSADDTKVWRDVDWSEEKQLFVAVGDAGVCMTSPDGVTWTTRSIGGSTAAHIRVRYCDDQFVVMSSTDGFAWTSLDGITWTSHAIASTGTIADWCWSTDLQKFITVGPGGSGIIRRFSKDFLTNDNGSPASISVGYFWNGCVWSRANQVFIAIGKGDSLLSTSPDGLTWTHLYHDSNSIDGGLSEPSGFGGSMVLEGLIYHESLSSEIASQVDSLARVSSDKGAGDASSSDHKLIHDPQSSSDQAHGLASDQHLSSDIQAKIRHDAASSSNVLQALHDLSDKHLRDAASSSDKPAKDAASSSDKPAKDAFSSDHHASHAAASDASLSNEIASEEASDLAHTAAPPVQIVATVCS